MALAYAPRTDTGTGFLVPMLKAAMRPMYIFGAIANSWPMTLEMAQGDMQDARARTTVLGGGDLSLLSEAGQAAVREWSATLDTVLTELQSAITDNGLEANVTEALVPSLVACQQQAWALLSLMDTELLGYTDDQTDPGRRP